MAFLATVKSKVIAGSVGGTAAIAGVVAAVVLSQGFRTIVVDELNGTTNVSNNKGVTNAYVGERLVSGDDVSVLSASDLTLNLDNDMYVYAEELTHFWLDATGNKDDSKTAIYMDEGCNLFRIDKKLKDSESFTVDTPNATMAVRGTVFRVNLREDGQGEKYTVVEVFEGDVFVACKYENKKELTGEDAVLHAGESAIIRSNSEISEFIKGPSGDFITAIDYHYIPKKTALKLGLAIDAGRELTITKDLLYDYVELVEHKYVAGDVIQESTTTTHGYYMEVCSVCGLEGEMVELPLLEESNDKKICDKNGHVASDNPLEVKEATCKEAGYIKAECKVCKEIFSEVLPVVDHKYGANHVINAATTESTGLSGATCEFCGTVDKTSTAVIPKLTPVAETPSSSSQDDDSPCSHSYSSSIKTAAKCNSAGVMEYRCSNCGDTYTESIAATGVHTYTVLLNDQTHEYIQESHRAAGSAYYACDGCGLETADAVVIPKVTDHVLDDIEPRGDGGGTHYLKCKYFSECEYQEEVACTYNIFGKAMADNDGIVSCVKHCTCSEYSYVIVHPFACPSGDSTCRHDGETCTECGNQYIVN